MLRRSALLLALSLPLLSLAAREQDPGEGATKHDLCLRLTYALCDRGGQVGCDGTLAECKTDVKPKCDTSFATDCAATQDSIEMIDHDIQMIINPKETCDALGAVLDYLNGTLGALTAADCASTPSSSSRSSAPDLGLLASSWPPRSARRSSTWAARARRSTSARPARSRAARS